MTEIDAELAAHMPRPIVNEEGGHPGDDDENSDDSKSSRLKAQNRKRTAAIQLARNKVNSREFAKSKTELSKAFSS